MVEHETSGTIGELDVTIEIEGEDEELADLVNLDLQRRCDELVEIVEVGKHPDAAHSDLDVDWSDYWYSHR